MTPAGEEAGARPGRNRDALLLGAVLLVAAFRFREFLAGGILTHRDAAFFFLPLREVVRRLLSNGELPLWNEWASHGRALAADPNGSVFWPLSPLLLVLPPTGLALLQLALALALFFLALRCWGLSSVAAAAGTCVVLFSGVFQALAFLPTTLQAAIPLPLAVVALSGPGAADRPLWRAAGAGLALGISVLGGEPVITALGLLACGLVVLAGAAGDLGCRDAASLRRRALAGAGAVILGVGVAAVQWLPTLEELGRSARQSSMRAEHGALFWSVRPSRLLTLLEPRLTGDPRAESAEDFWGAPGFDAGNPYFEDLAIGVLPLVLAFAALPTRRGRSALLLAGAGALVATGRFLPGFAWLAAKVPIVRYPEKAWLLATLALAAAAAIGVDALVDPEGRRQGLARLRLAALGVASALGLLLVPAVLFPSLLRRSLWALGLGFGDAPPERVAALLLPLLASSFAAVLLVALLAGAARDGRLGRRAGGAAAAGVLLLFLLDAERRVAGTLPASDPALLSRRSPEVDAVLAEMPRGRFFDDGADDVETAVRRAMERDGFDPLRPVTGILFGVRYGGENDIDRMTPASSFAWFRLLAALPWGEEKVERLRASGVSVARTRAPLVGAGGEVTVLRVGQDRIVRIPGARPEFALLPEGRLVPTGASLPFSPAVPVVEVDGRRAGPARFAPGDVDVPERRASFQRLVLSPAAGERLLFVGRTYDVNWRARADGRAVPLLRADGFLSALLLPAGTREVTLSYENGRIRTGGLVTAASLLVAAGLFAAGSRGGA